jgi:hypothetical protein
MKPSMYIYTIMENDISFVKWLFNRGCPWNKFDVFKSAIVNDNTEILEFLLQVCPHDTYIFRESICHGNLEIIKMLYEEGCEWYKEDILIWAIHYGNLDIVKYLYENGFKWNEDMFRDMCENGSLQFMIDKIELYSHDHEDACMYTMAIINHDLEMIQYLHDNKFSWGNGTLQIAISFDNLDIVKYIYENWSSWDREYDKDSSINSQSSIYDAIKHSNLDMLEFMREEGCTWGEDEMEAAIECGDLDIIEYLHETGARFNSNSITMAKETGFPDVLEYVQGNVGIKNR